MRSIYRIEILECSFLQIFERMMMEFFQWRINIDGITSNYKNIWKAIDGGRCYDKPILFLKV